MIKNLTFFIISYILDGNFLLPPKRAQIWFNSFNRVLNLIEVSNQKIKFLIKQN